MNERDPKLTVLMFNEYINTRDLDGLTALMTDDHIFIDRDNGRHQGKDRMSQGWRDFFGQFPNYRNTFVRVQSSGALVTALGYAEWTLEGEPDHVIWTAMIRDDLVAEWRVLEDTDGNRESLGLT